MLYRQDWPRTLKDLRASASRVLGLKACATTAPAWMQFTLAAVHPYRFVFIPVALLCCITLFLKFFVFGFFFFLPSKFCLSNRSHVDSSSCDIKHNFSSLPSQLPQVVTYLPVISLEGLLASLKSHLQLQFCFRSHIAA